jgi:phospholipid/cholesterol/gamma-HCH transport system substrate-binding protein
MKRSLFETVIGALVIVVAAVFLFYAYEHSSLVTRSGYPVKAAFLSVGGLTSGSDVRIGGVKVGSVTDLKLDQQKYLAVVTMSVNDGVKIPQDTQVSIVSDGLLGGQYVDLLPGKATEMVLPGGVLKNTKDVKTIEQILGEAIYVIAKQSSGESPDGSSESDGTEKSAEEPRKSE